MGTLDLRLRRLRPLALALLLVPALAATAAAPGALDPSFGAGGKLITNLTGTATAVAVQPDGGILVAGASGGDFLLARFLPNGDPDPDFGDDGVVLTDFGGDEAATALLLQPDGRIVVGGSATTLDSDLLLARYEPDGDPDTSFGSDGQIRASYLGGSDVLSALALQPDGKIVLAGRTSALPPFYSVLVARLHADGSFDADFSGDGMLTDGISSTHSASVVAIQPDGKIVIAGSAESVGTAKVGGTLLIRYTADGQRDTSFGNNGGVIWEVRMGYPAYRSLLAQPDGKLLAGGSSFTEGAFLVRYTAAGQRDASFGSAGITRVAADQTQVFVALAQPLGGATVALGYRSEPQPRDFVLARFSSAGKLDPSFGSGGLATTDFGANDTPAALALQRDGQLVAAGDSGTSIVLARYGGDTQIFLPIAE